jgi:uncharacterized protein
MLLRITGPADLYEEARAAGMHFWEQIQSFAVRHREFQTSKRPLPVPEDAAPIVRRMVELSARAGVGPMFSFQGALTEFVGEMVARRLREVVVSCREDRFVVSRRRARLPVQRASAANGGSLAVVLKPALGPHGIYSTLGNGSGDGLVVVATSCILADAAAAAATAILARAGRLDAALGHLNGIPGVHGAIVLRGDRIGVAGSLELAA